MTAPITTNIRRVNKPLNRRWDLTSYARSNLFSMSKDLEALEPVKFFMENARQESTQLVSWDNAQARQQIWDRENVVF